MQRILHRLSSEIGFRRLHYEIAGLLHVFSMKTIVRYLLYLGCNAAQVLRMRKLTVVDAAMDGKIAIMYRGHLLIFLLMKSMR